MRGFRGMGEGIANGAAGALARAIDESVSDYASNDSTAGNFQHKGFHDWLLERNIFGADPQALMFLLAGPIGAGGVRAAIRDRLPVDFRRGARGTPGYPEVGPHTGSGRSGRTHTTGERLSDGVYIYSSTANNPLAHGLHGRLRGRRIRSEWFRWKQWIRERVVKGTRPAARAELELLVGWQGGIVPSTGRIWTSTDPVAPGSALGNLQEAEEHLERLITLTTAECTRTTALEEELLGESLDQAELARIRLDERRAEWQRIARGGLVAVVLIAAARRLG